MTDITPEAVERLADQAGFMCRDGFRNSDDLRWQIYGEFDATLRALSAALSASQAETAAAYEAAAYMIESHVVESDNFGKHVVPSKLAKEDQHHRILAVAIRALTPADSKAALDRMIAEARADGMREAAALVWGSDNDVARWERGFLQDRILAAIPKGDDK